MIELDFKQEVVRASPIVAAGATDVVHQVLYGMSMNELFYAAAIAYTLVQIVIRIVSSIMQLRKALRKEREYAANKQKPN